MSVFGSAPEKRQSLIGQIARHEARVGALIQAFGLSHHPPEERSIRL